MKILVKNRSGHDMSHMGPYLKSFLPYAQKRMGFNRPPTIFFDSDPQNAENVLGKTAYYNPETEEIVVFVDKRHPKDILRSLSHELIHHTQNCRGDLSPEIAGETTPGYAQTNAHMRAMEGEAYLKGNGYYFRDWEDSLKNGLEETNYKHITGDTHKMATYDQLKEEITAKVVAALSEKLTNKVEEEAKPDFLDLDGDGDKEEPMKKAAKDKELKKEASYDPDSQESGGYTDSTRGGGAREKFVEAMASQMQKKLINMEDDGTYVKAIFEDGTKGFVGMAAGADGVEAYLYDHRNGVSISDPAEAAAKLDAELKERKKRDTPRDSDRREAEKLKVNEKKHKTEPELEPQVNKPKAKDAPPEEIDEAHCGDREDEDDPYAMARHYTQRDSGRYGSGRNEGKEELEEISSDYGPDGYDPGRDGGHSGRSMTNAEREAAYQRAMRKIEADKRKAKEQANLEKRVGSAMGGMGYGLEEAQKKEVVEETISNDEWYQNELFESLKKRWTK